MEIILIVLGLLLWAIIGAVGYSLPNAFLRKTYPWAYLPSGHSTTEGLTMLIISIMLGPGALIVWWVLMKKDGFKYKGFNFRVGPEP